MSRETVTKYFDNLTDSIKDVVPAHIINYDETNLADDPGRKKVILRRGTKYPERVMNQSKYVTSVMYAGTAEPGVEWINSLLPCFHLMLSTRRQTCTTRGQQEVQVVRDTIAASLASSTCTVFLNGS